MSHNMSHLNDAIPDDATHFRIIGVEHSSERYFSATLIFYKMQDDGKSLLVWEAKEGCIGWVVSALTLFSVYPIESLIPASFGT